MDSGAARGYHIREGKTKSDAYIPDLLVEETKPIGRWGRLRKNYLKEHHPAVYSNMLLGGMLYQHLAEIDEAADERIDLITKQLVAKRGITEKLKAANHLLWVQEMNSICAAAEEPILAELIYAF